MTWFGIVVAIWWFANIASSFYIIGTGGIEVTPGNALFSAFISSVLLLGLFFVGTGLGVF